MSNHSKWTMWELVEAEPWKLTTVVCKCCDLIDEPLCPAPLSPELTEIQNGGHCQPAMYATQPHIASFELRNYSYLKSLVEEYSIPCDWHTTTGVHAFYSASLFSTIEEVIQNLTDHYPDLAANVAVITKGKGGSPPWLLEGERTEYTLEALRIPTAEGAVVQWHAASLWPYKLVAFVLERLLAAEAGGFNLQTNTPVTGLQKASPPPASLTGQDGTKSGRLPWEVQTPRGSITARTVLLATNAYTSHLLPQFADLIVPTRGQVASLKPPQQPNEHEHEPPLDIGHTYYILGDETDKPLRRDEYLVQRPPPEAELVLGGGRHLARGMAVGVWDDSFLDKPVSWWLRGELPDIMDLSIRSPATSSDPASRQPQPLKKQDLQPTHEWTGIMGFSRDAHPWVGPVPESLGGGDGLWVAAGYTGHGMPNAALCGKAAAELMTGEEEVDLPLEFEVSEERVVVARTRDTVAAAEEQGTLRIEVLT
jgi:glycine/D-amino acid oxidase-like deaminating enzyme